MPAWKHKTPTESRPPKDTYRNLVRVNYALGALGILLLTFIFVLYISAEFRRMRSAEDERLRLLSNATATRFESLVSNLLVTMRLLDQWIQDHPDRDPRFDPEFNRLVEVFRTHNDRQVDLRMVSDSGGLFYLPSESATPLSDVSDREYYTESKKVEPNGLYFAKAVKSRVTGLWGIPITYRLHANPHGIFLLFGAIEFPLLDKALEPQESLPNFSIIVLRKDKTILYRYPFDETLVGQKVTQETIPDKVSVVNVSVPKPEQRLATLHPLTNFDLSVAIAESWTSLLSGWTRSLVVKSVAGLAILALYSFLTFRTIASQKKNNEIQRMLQTAARYDSLTGLKNRGYFIERFGDELDRAQRYGIPLVFMILDIDHFKVLNDTQGHPEGDAILKKIAGIIDSCIRSSDISGRVGGEEFALILSDLDLMHALPVAERIREKVSSISVGSWKAGISIGAVAWRGPEESLTDLYKRADGALYRAKSEGRNRVIAEAG